MSKKLIYALITVGTLLSIWFAPMPAGLSSQAWHIFAIFMAVVVGLILAPVPTGALVLMALVFAVITKTLTLAQALTAFSNPTVWLVVSAYMYAQGFIKTGFAKRLAYIIMRAFGDSSLKLGYCLGLSNFILGPAIPANTARSGGVIFPIVTGLCQAFDSLPGPSAKRIGTYLMTVAFQVDFVVCAMFMTAVAPNPLVAEMAKKMFNVDITWTTWFLAGLAPGIIGLIVIPYAVYKLCPPEVKHTPEAKELAAAELEKLGAFSGKEKIVGCIFVGSIILWAIADKIAMNPATVCLLGICIMLATNVVTWDDILKQTGAWDVFVWMGGVVLFAGLLNTTGFMPWFSKQISASMGGISWGVALPVAIAIYVYSHYGFASLTAHVTAMYGALVTVAITAGTPPFLAVFSMALASSLCGCLTQYGSGPGPIYYAAGYVDQGTWWRIGFILSFIFLFIFLGIGSVWWKTLGFW
jgi:DASS family divalent anion:Na+ symporter